MTRFFCKRCRRWGNGWHLCLGMVRGLMLMTLVVSCGGGDIHGPAESGSPVECRPDSAIVREYILACVEKGNPHSDEEPEDLVYACRMSLPQVFCGLGCYYSNISTRRGTVYCTESRYRTRGKSP